jgi:dTDP-4-dehydrorhamnose 3,5-epimerase
MKIIETGFNGLLIIEPSVFEDERGYFFESYNQQRYKETGMTTEFVQDNESKSTYGVVRGLHFQIEPYAQTKLVRVVSGKILDVALDLRVDSQTYGSYYAIELSDKNKRQFYIPKGFAHGFSVLSKTAIVNYKCDNYYHKDAERGINLFDKELSIDWGIDQSRAIVSEKDKYSPDFSNSEVFF